MRVLRSAGTWLFTMNDGHTRAWARGRRSKSISTICRTTWQHDNAIGAVALLRSGSALAARGHGAGKTCLSTGSDATYRDRNAVAGNRATSQLTTTAIYANTVREEEQSIAAPDVVRK